MSVLTKSLAMAKKLACLGIHGVEDLLYYLPYRYDDFTHVVPIKDLKAGEVVAVEGVIIALKAVRTWRQHMQLIEMRLGDGTGVVRVIWFNQLYLLKIFRKGLRVALAGRVYENKRGIYFANPAYELTDAGALHTRRLVPVYRETKGVTSRAIRTLAARHLAAAERLPDVLPEATSRRENFPPLGDALRIAHFPKTLYEAASARRRLQFEELFLYQMRFLQERTARARERAHPIPFNQALIKPFVDALPFMLTDDQRKAAWQILQDLAKPYPMQRLLEGDVGSGKTIVAFLAAYEAAKSGYQVVLMAPTEVLARQHFENAKRYLASDELVTGLITSASRCVTQYHIGTVSEKKVTEKAFGALLAEGKIHIAIGTHALISERIVCKDLALAIIDEQHRFGVDQRALLLKKSGDRVFPHFLSMSATPIPRTLALAVYGDLDISRIKQKPAGRQPPETQVVAPYRRSDAYAFIRSQVRAGRQAFVICPRIEVNADRDEQSPASVPLARFGEGIPGLQRPTPGQRLSVWSEAKAVKDEYEKLSKTIFPDLRVAMLHGRMKPKEKSAVMKKFAARECDILVSTSVIEVGVDVPNATVMAIEGADRFGLAQLHQFRGRVGRGTHKSYCLLLSDSAGAEANARLRALLQANDGFALAQLDLELRGPGELMGEAQAGMPDIAMEALRNPSLIESAREDAKTVLTADPDLVAHTHLRQRVQKLGEKVHNE